MANVLSVINNVHVCVFKYVTRVGHMWAFVHVWVNSIPGHLCHSPSHFWVWEIFNSPYLSIVNVNVVYPDSSVETGGDALGHAYVNAQGRDARVC